MRMKNGGFLLCLSVAAITVFLFLNVGAAVVFARQTAETYRSGDRAEFGSYPQSEVKDSVLCEKLNKAISEWTSYGFYLNGKRSDYMRYADIELGGEKYRGVEFSEYRSFGSYFGDGSEDSSYQDDNGYTVGNAYWFKYEPVRWRVLDAANDGTALLIAEKILDVREFYHTYDERTVDGKTVYPNNYRYCKISEWLKSSFLDGIFDDAGKAALLMPDTDTERESDMHSYSTVYLPSYADVCDACYGFDSNPFGEDSVRKASGTDYAKCLGLYDDSGVGFCSWWLRTAGEQNDTAYRVDGNGLISDDFVDNCLGIRPAIRIDLNSEADFSKVHNYTAKTAAPTCSEGGYTVYTCEDCGDEYTTDYIPASGHNKVTAEEKPATCTEDGHEAYEYCTKCDYTTFKEITASGHKKVTAEEKPATCTEDGHEAYEYCTKCNYTTFKEIPASGHDEITHEAKAATCVESGCNAYVTCSRCDYTTLEEIPALGHDKEKCAEKPATCTEDGHEAYEYCTKCDYTTFKDIPASGHKKVKAEEKPATCTEDGHEAYEYCTKCVYTTFKKIPATGHREVTDPSCNATCVIGGLTAGRHCAVCGKITAAQLQTEPKGHSDSDRDGVCDTCGAKDIYGKCDHLCHSEKGFTRFVWKLLCAFLKMFKKQQFCDCGVRHW